MKQHNTRENISRNIRDTELGLITLAADCLDHFGQKVCQREIFSTEL